MKIIQGEIMAPIPSHQADPPWDAWLPCIANHPPGSVHLVHSQPGHRKEAVRTVLEINQAFWHMGIHWMFKKKWASKHKIPASRATAKAAEPFGEHLFRLMELTIQLHAMRKTGYPNAASWFACIVQELQRREQVLSIQTNAGKHQGKSAAIKELRRQVRALKSGVNPYSRDELQNLAILVDLALGVPVEMDRFHGQYWDPFVRSIAYFATELQNNPGWKVIQVGEDGTLFFQDGQGRHRVNFEVAKNVSLKSLAG